MKKIFLICFILLSFTLSAEEVKKSYYSNGKLRFEMSKGFAKEYYENGNLKGEGTEHNFKTYYKDGKLKSEGTPKSIKNYYKDGKMLSEIYLLNDNNENKEGILKTYWYNGKLMSETKLKEYYFDLNKVYYENGNLWIDFNHNKSGEYFTGTLKTYYDNGVLAEEIESENGTFIGKIKVYYPNGELKAEESLSNEEGDYKTFYMNGRLAEEINFKKLDPCIKIISGVRYDSNGLKINLTDEEIDDLNKKFCRFRIRNDVIFIEINKFINKITLEREENPLKVSEDFKTEVKAGYSNLDFLTTGITIENINRENNKN